MSRGTLALLLVAALICQTLAQEVSTSGCNVSKGCFVHPAGCKSSTECDFIVTYSPNKTAGAVEFEVSAKATGWVALGFNTLPKMDKAAGEICSSGASKPMRGFNNTAYSPAFHTMASNVASGAILGFTGFMVCRFGRSIETTQLGSYQMALNQPLHLIVAAGNNLIPTGAPKYHTIRTASILKYNVADFTVVVQPTQAANATNATTAAPTAMPSVVPPATSNVTTANPSAEPSTKDKPSAEPTTAYMSKHPPTTPNSAGIVMPTAIAIISGLLASKWAIQ